MIEVPLVYGDGKMTVSLPDSTTVFWPGRSHQDPPEVDPTEATLAALAKPCGSPPLRKPAKSGDRVIIAFPDRVKGGVGEKTHRGVSIPIITREIESAGVRCQASGH